MPTTIQPVPTKNLSAVTSTGAGAWVDVADVSRIAVLFEASSVTTGGTITIEAKDSGGTAVTLHTETIAADGDTWCEFATPVTAIRTNLTARTDGTYTTTIYVRRGGA